MNFAAFLDWINGINDENDNFIQDSKWGTKAEDGSIRWHDDSSSSNSIVATNWCIGIIEFCFLRRLNVWHEKTCCCCWYQHCDDVEWNLILIVRDFGVFFSSFDKERMVGSWKMHQSVSTPNRETVMIFWVGEKSLSPERIASKFFRIKIDLWPFTFFHDYYDPAKEWMSHLTENGLALEQTQIQT